MADFNLGAALASYKENNELTILESGSHTLECVSASSGTAAKGPTITPVFKVYSGPQTGARVMVGKMSFAENALWKTIPQVKGFGITDDFMLQADSQPEPIKMIAEAMVGRVVEANVNVEQWQGEPRNKLVSVRLADAVTAPAPPTPAVAAPPAAAPPAAATPPPQPGTSVPTPSF